MFIDSGSYGEAVRINRVSVYSLNDVRLIAKVEDLDRIDMSHLANGIYYIKIESARGHIIKEVIKN